MIYTERPDHSPFPAFDRSKESGHWEREKRRSKPETFSQNKLTLPSSTGVTKAAVVSFDLRTFGADDQPQHETTVYWELSGNVFATHLNYIIGDQRADQHEKALVALLRSIKPE